MIGLIVARSKNNVIGKNGNIPWKIKGDIQHFSRNKPLTNHRLISFKVIKQKRNGNAYNNMI